MIFGLKLGHRNDFQPKNKEKEDFPKISAGR